MFALIVKTDRPTVRRFGATAQRRHVDTAVSSTKTLRVQRVSPNRVEKLLGNVKLGGGWLVYFIADRAGSGIRGQHQRPSVQSFEQQTFDCRLTVWAAARESG